jgi:acetylornithine deacetylase
MGTLSSSIDTLKRLVAFDTTSRNSNLELIHYIREYLDGFGVRSTLVPNEKGTKANLFASIGRR